jgi:RND family efflux transporter MFP subunit
MNPGSASYALHCLRVAAIAGSLAGPTAFAQPTVRVVQPEERPFAYTSAQVGSAEAFYEADLGAKVSGYVSELLVDVGSRVREGQVLARISVPEMVEVRNAAVSEVAARRSEYERTTMLAERNSITQRALAEAKNRLDTAIAQQAEVEAQMAYATIEAPFAGVVTTRAIDPGDMVFEASSPKGSAQPLLRVARLDVIRVKTYVPEREAVWTDVGDAATVVFDALPGRAFAGTIARVSGAIDPATRTMLAEIDLPNEDGRIRPGFYGQTRIVLESRERSLALPTSAVRYDDSGAYVLSVAAGDVVRRTAVEIGLDVGGWVEIVGDLSGGERVIDGPAVNVTDGTVVRVAAQ